MARGKRSPRTVEHPSVRGGAADSSCGTAQAPPHRRRDRQDGMLQYRLHLPQPRLAASSWRGPWDLRYAASTQPSPRGLACFLSWAMRASPARCAFTSLATQGMPAATSPPRGRLLFCTGSVVLLAGLFCTPALARGNPGLAQAYRIAFCGLAFTVASIGYTFALQARDMRRWNRVRVCQPLLALAAFVVLWQLRLLTLNSAIGVVVVTMAVQLRLRLLLMQADRAGARHRPAPAGRTTRQVRAEPNRRGDSRGWSTHISTSSCFLRPSLRRTLAATPSLYRPPWCLCRLYPR